MAKLTLSEDVLAELERLALKHTLPLPPHLSYARIQQQLTLYSLLEYFKERGIELPFELEKVNEDNTADKRIRDDR